MNSSIQIQEIAFATPAYDETIRLRMDILRTPLGLGFSVADLEKEYQYYHLAAYSPRQKMLGCLVLVPLEEGRVKMIQVAVREEVQGQGIGRLLVWASERFAQKHGFTEMVLNAREVATPFYEKLQYEKIGEPFEEVGIPHFKMSKAL